MSKKPTEIETKKLVEAVVQAATEKKGMDITVMDMQGVTLICDNFVIISGNSRPHTRSIAQGIVDALKDELDIADKNVQGKEEGSWVLLDYGTVVVHIFLENLRAYYDLEGLWTKTPSRKSGDKVSTRG